MTHISHLQVNTPIKIHFTGNDIQCISIPTTCYGVIYGTNEAYNKCGCLATVTTQISNGGWALRGNVIDISYISSCTAMIK